MGIENNYLKKNNVNFNSCILNENKLWFVSLEGYFMNIDVDTKKASYIKLKNLNSWKNHPVIDNMFVYETSIYWVDQFGKNIYEYDTKQNEYYCYQLPLVEMIEWQCFAGVYLYSGKLFLFPRGDLFRIEFDLEKKKYMTYQWERLCVDYSISHEDSLQLWCSIQYNNWVYLFEKSRNRAIRMNFENFKYEYIDIPYELSNIQHIVLSNNVFYILSTNGNLYTWDGSSEHVSKIYNCHDVDLSFSRIAVTENKVFLLPGLSKKILVVNLQNYGIMEHDEYPEDFEYQEREWSKYFGFAEDQQNIWFANRTANYILHISKCTESIEWIRIIPPEAQEKWNVYMETEKMILTENEKELALFIELECGKKKKEQNRKRWGEYIWNTINST